MTALVAALVIAVAQLGDGRRAVGLDDGTVWLRDEAGEWQELGGCEDSALEELREDAGALALACADGTTWRWSDAAGWEPRGGEAPSLDASASARPWWPTFELAVRSWTSPDEPRAATEVWLRLRWGF